MANTAQCLCQRASFAGTYDLQYEIQPIPGQPWSDLLPANISRLLFQTIVGATIGDFRAEAIWEHREGFDVTPTVANNFQTYAGLFNVIDLFLRYHLHSTRLVNDIVLTLSINNLFDQDPPIYYGISQTILGNGYINGQTLGRQFILGLSKTF
jgi:iron complex outermembrane receptor protein